MIDIKQLKYFMTCADAGSFSEAAAILYTTQSSVSKVIRALEEEMQTTLFVRNPHGISLTASGRQAYAYAGRVLENVDAMAELSASGDTEWLNLSCNPSSWMANCFVDFYHLHEAENLHCQVHTGKMREILDRVHQYKDELGFIFVNERQENDLQYHLVRKQLEFIPLKSLETRLYLGGGCSDKKDGISQKEVENLRFIQHYLGDAESYEGWQLEGTEGICLGKVDVSVVTNSDYIMEKMLDHGKLANISGGSLNNGKQQNMRNGMTLSAPKGEETVTKLTFGYVKREKDLLSKWADCFLVYIRQALELPER